MQMGMLTSGAPKTHTLHAQNSDVRGFGGIPLFMHTLKCSLPFLRIYPKCPRFPTPQVSVPKPQVSPCLETFGIHPKLFLQTHTRYVLVIFWTLNHVRLVSLLVHMYDFWKFRVIPIYRLQLHMTNYASIVYCCLSPIHIHPCRQRLWVKTLNP